MSEAPPVEVTLCEITELVRTFKESGWASLDLEIHGVHLVLGRDGPPNVPTTSSTTAPTPAPPAAVEPAPVTAPAPATSPARDTAPTPAPPAVGVTVSANAVEVRSPAIGAFWVAPSPGEAPFAVVGQRVEADQQLAIVEIMKLMSQVSSSVAGTVVQVCATNADLVEFDQVLFLIDPADD
jgi:acetyl-CoA carboxylase biotin carboxyl carrier protein